jgi:preprotein translocase subunit SecF
MLDKLKKFLVLKSEFGPIATLFDFFQGRSTFFAIIFLLVGIALSGTAIWGIVHGRDISGIAGIIASLAAFMGSLQTLLFAHSAKEDWVRLQTRKLDIMEQQGKRVEPGATITQTEMKQ